MMGLFGSSKKVTKDEPGFVSPATDTVALVTGSSGLCGARLVEMLLERGTKTVIAFDLSTPPMERFDAIQKSTGGTIIICSGKEDGDLTNDDAVKKAFEKVKQINIVYHVAALVGPYHDHDAYYKVNVEGTRSIIDNCKNYNVPKLVYSSSPGTRFTGADIENLSEDDLPIPNKFLALYAETKAIGEVLVKDACNNDTLLTIAVAPHQIYGKYDRLFLQKFLEVAGNGRLRIFGTGHWKISVCHVDNYAHGLMCGADALYKDSPALAKFYIITDDEPQIMWDMVNRASIYMGFDDLNNKFHLPVWFLYIIAGIANALGFILNKKFKLNFFSLRMSTMHRYFNIKNAKQDLKYKPIRTFDEAFPDTLEWFKMNWLPKFLENKKKKKNGNINNKKEE